MWPWKRNCDSLHRRTLHSIQSPIQSNYSVSVLSGDLYQGTLIFVKDDDYNVCTVCGEDKGFENSSLSTVKTNSYSERIGKAFAKQANEQVDKTYGKGTSKNKQSNKQATRQNV